MDRDEFVSRFGGAYEHSAWVAESAFDLLVAREGDHGIAEIVETMRDCMRAADADAHLRLIRAHPDLAGKLAMAKRLTADSTSEQAGAGLDRLTTDEYEKFSDLNQQYQERFGFPFIMAVAGKDKQQILEAFERRLQNSREQEFACALDEIDRIALLRMENHWRELSR